MTRTGTERDMLLEDLAEYGRNGSFARLATISGSLHAIAIGGIRKSCKIPLDISLSVLRQCTSVLRNSNNSDMKKSVWYIFAFLCDRQFNALASDFLTEIEASDILSFVPKSVANISVRNEMEAVWCLQFVSCFGKSSDHRPVILGTIDGLVESLLHAIDTDFEPLHDMLKGKLLSTLLFAVSENDPVSPATFLRKDGFRIVNKVFHRMYQLAVVGRSNHAATFTGVEEVQVLSGCLSALYAVFNSCSRIDATVDELPRSMYSYDPAGLIQITSALHDFISLSRNPTFVQTTITSVICFLSFVEKVHPESLEFALLYRGKKLSPTTYSGVPMIIQAGLITRDPQYKHYMDMVCNCMLKYFNRFPSVDAMLSDSSMEPVSGPVPNICAWPGCLVSSLSNNHALKQCGRCRAVYYCTEGHQRQHWKEHKLVCVPKDKGGKV